MSATHISKLLEVIHDIFYSSIGWYTAYKHFFISLDLQGTLLCKGAIGNLLQLTLFPSLFDTATLGSICKVQYTSR